MGLRVVLLLKCPGKLSLSTRIYVERNLEKQAIRDFRLKEKLWEDVERILYIL